MVESHLLEAALGRVVGHAANIGHQRVDGADEDNLASRAARHHVPGHELAHVETAVQSPLRSLSNVSES